MLSSKEGQTVPDVTFRVRQDGQWHDVTTEQIFAGRTVVVFALPGAFTPTCSSAHVPRYNELYDSFRQTGVDEVVCISVNDAFVMDAWKEDQKADRITFLPDGNGTFTRALGMLVAKENLGFGERSWRYSMVVRNKVIEKMFIEPDEPGDPFRVSDADTMLSWLGGESGHDIALFTRPGCVHCHRAMLLLQQHKMPFAELPTSPRILRALPGPRTTPQVFVDGQHIGGADELERWLQEEEGKRRQVKTGSAAT